jgi:uncharacterized protein YfaP (DUF2135 family)
VFTYEDTPIQVSGGREALFGVTFAPVAEGTFEQILTFTTDGDPAIVELHVKGTGVRELVTIDPLALDFGPVVLTRTKTLQIQIANPGGVPSLVSLAGTGGTDAASFTAALVSGDAQKAYLQPGESVMVDVTFAPTIKGSQTATLGISSCDGCTPLDVALTGFGLDQSLVVGPCPMDFGTVLPETPVTKELTIENAGPYPVTVNTVRPAQAGDFSVTPLASTQYGATPELKPGDKITLQVTYLPSGVGADVNVLLIDSNDEAAPRVMCELMGASDCDNAGGNGLAERGCYSGPDGTAGVGACRAGAQSCTSAGWSECVGQVLPQVSGACSASTSDTNCDGTPDPAQPAPTADAGADQVVEPLDTVTLNGSASIANPSGSALTYTWRVIRKPPGSNTSVQGSGARPTMWADLAGEYEIGLKVTGTNSCVSSEDSVLVTAIPRSKIHIQLIWDIDKVDVDLHYKEPNGQWFDYLFSSDCFYSTQGDCDFGSGAFPDGRTNNDPTLDRDDIDGLGPENINHDAPFNGTYRIAVNYFCAFRDNRDMGRTNATVRVYVDGIKKLEVVKSLTERDFWEAASVSVSGTAVTVTALTAAPYRTTDQLGYCTH